MIYLYLFIAYYVISAIIVGLDTARSLDNPMDIGMYTVMGFILLPVVIVGLIIYGIGSGLKVLVKQESENE